MKPASCSSPGQVPSKTSLSQEVEGSLAMEEKGWTLLLLHLGGSAFCKDPSRKARCRFLLHTDVHACGLRVSLPSPPPPALNFLVSLSLGPGTAQFVPLISSPTPLWKPLCGLQ